MEPITRRASLIVRYATAHAALVAGLALLVVFLFYLTSSAINIERSKLLLSLIQAIVWPAIILIVILTFREAIRSLLSTSDKITVKAGASGVEATVERQQIEAAALLGAATGKQQTVGDDQTSNVTQARSIATVVSANVQPSTVSSLSRSSVLWVDDRPSNNVFEREALSSLGIAFTTSTSTDDALKKLSTGTYDAIISDMGRPGDPRAGYTLLEKVRHMGINTPYIIYAGSNAPQHNAEAQRRGAYGSTGNPSTLFELVIGALERTDGRK